MVNTNTNAAVDKIMDGLKVKCININTQHQNGNNDGPTTAELVSNGFNPYHQIHLGINFIT